MGASITPPPVGVTWSVCAVGWQAPDCESPWPGTLGENRALATAEAPCWSTTRRATPPPAARTCVGSAAPLAPSRVAAGTPWSAQGFPPFFTVRAYSICPAPALPATMANVPASWAPVQGAADVADPAVVVGLHDLVAANLLVECPCPSRHPVVARNEGEDRSLHGRHLRVKLKDDAFALPDDFLVVGVAEERDEDALDAHGRLDHV